MPIENERLHPSDRQELQSDAHCPPLNLKIRALLWWNLLYAVTVVSSLTFLVGPFIYPQTIGLFLVLPYLTFNLFVKRDELKRGNPWPSFSQNFSAFHCLRKYLGLEFSPLPKELVVAENIPNAQFIFAVFPHGTNVDYRILMDGILHQVLPNVADKIRVLSASVLFRIPIVRELCLWTRCVDARRKVAEGLLDAQMSILVIPGGMDEQIRTQHGREEVFLSKRKGLIKLAMRKGVPVVPVYVFGCSDMFYTSNAFFGLRLWIMKKLGMCIPLCAGFAWSSCPLPVKTTIAMGKPMSFETKERGQPTEEELDLAHASFSKALVDLFNKHKSSLGYGNRNLEIK